MPSDSACLPVRGIVGALKEHVAGLIRPVIWAADRTQMRALRVSAGGRDELQPAHLTGGPVELRGGTRGAVTPGRRPAKDAGGAEHLSGEGVRSTAAGRMPGTPPARP